MRTLRIFAVLAGVCCGTFSSLSFAQLAAGPTPTFATSSAATKDWSSSSSSQSYQQAANDRHLGIGLTAGGLIAGRWNVANGGIFGLDIVWRRALRSRLRLEIGGMGRFGVTRDAVLIGGGIPFRFVSGISDRFETTIGLELSYTNLIFSQPFFVPRHGFVTTARWDVGYLVDPGLSFGITPLSLSLIAGERVDAFVSYEPGIWVRFSPI